MIMPLVLGLFCGSVALAQHKAGPAEDYDPRRWSHEEESGGRCIGHDCPGYGYGRAYADGRGMSDHAGRLHDVIEAARHDPQRRAQLMIRIAQSDLPPGIRERALTRLATMGDASGPGLRYTEAPRGRDGTDARGWQPTRSPQSDKPAKRRSAVCPHCGRPMRDAAGPWQPPRREAMRGWQQQAQGRRQQPDVPPERRDESDERRHRGDAPQRLEQPSRGYESDSREEEWHARRMHELQERETELRTELRRRQEQMRRRVNEAMRQAEERFADYEQAIDEFEEQLHRFDQIKQRFDEQLEQLTESARQLQQKLEGADDDRDAAQGSEEDDNWAEPYEGHVPR
jgi:hypothetical protein